jgi:hypothetical protein
MGNAMDYAVKQDIFPQVLQQLRLQPQVDVLPTATTTCWMHTAPSTPQTAGRQRWTACC